MRRRWRATFAGPNGGKRRANVPALRNQTSSARRARRATSSGQRRVLLISGCGWKNYGDDIIARHWLSHYRGCPAMLLSGGPHTDFLGQPDNLVERSTFQSLFAGTLNDEFVCAGGRVHLLGGGYLNDFFQTASPLVGALKSFAARGVQLVCTGASFFPLADVRPLAELPFEHCSLRDRFSASLPLERAVPLLLGDDSYLIPEKRLKHVEPRATHRTLLVCVQAQFGCEDHLERIGQAIGRLARRGDFEVVRIARLCAGDERIFDFVDFPLKDLIRYEDLMKNGVPRSDGSYFISTRFHLRLLCERFGVPGLGLVINPYYRNKHEAATDEDRFLFVGPAFELDDFCQLERLPPATSTWRAQMWLRRLKLRALARRNLRMLAACENSAAAC